MSGLRPVWAEVDLGAVRSNVRALRSSVAPAEVLAVVKADAYGHGAVPVSRAVLDAGATWLGVALVEEGVALRAAGVEAPILVLSEPPAGAAAAVVAHGLVPAAYTVAGIEALAKAVAESGADRLNVHLKVDTGMHRVGCAPADAVGLARLIEEHGELRLGGVWTHLAVADEPDDPYTDEQLDRFDAVLGEVRTAGIDPGLVHAANTAGALAFPRARYDLVRVGIGLYGIPPAPALAPLAESLRPALSVKARISHVKTLGPGARLSYGLRYTLAHESRIATVPIGYADGVPRNLAQTGGEVLVRGRRHAIAGRVTMDQLMVDLGDSGAEIGEEVVLLGRQDGEEIGAPEWAERLGTIAYEVVCGFGSRVPRRYAG